MKYTSSSQYFNKLQCHIKSYLDLEKNRVGRSEKYIYIYIFFWSKMCVLCMFYVDWGLVGRKKL